MDNQKFGIFISTIRKEKGWTQLELAEKLNVTDKTVSKWERGLGFPDIKTLEPLATALDVSILELMQSERLSKEQIPANSASQALVDVIDVLSYQRKIERRNIFCCIISSVAIILGAFLIDIMKIEGIIFACVPLIFLSIAMWLILASWNRYKHKLAYKTMLLLGVILLLFPIILCLILYFAFVLGGPVPN